LFLPFTGGDGSNESVFRFETTDKIRIYDSGTTRGDLNSSRVFRDPSAWYHIVLSVDLTQATSTNRVRLYVNNELETLTGTYPAQNTTWGWNNTSTHYVGSYRGSSSFLDGYLTEINFINGQALTPSSFGETDTTTGSWVAKKYTGTYGTNGFYLKFADASAATAAAIGKDSSGNGNNWTPSGISVTAGTTYDAMIDSPTLTSATVSNYCVLNPLQKYSGLSAPTNGNLTIAGNSANWRSILSTFAVSSGKWYCEINMTSVSTDALVGIFNINNASDLNDLTTVDNRQLARYSGGYGYQNNGNKVNNNTGTSYGATWTTGDVIAIALDMDAGTITFYKNNTSQGTAYSSLSGLFAIGISTANGTFNANFGQRPFAYTPPTGYVALNTFNLPDSTIKKGNTVMDATLYTGTATTQSITNAGSFKPDLVWVKIRSGAGQHVLTDSVRGVSKQVFSSLTNAETTEAGKGITAFNSNGFTLGDELVGTGSTNANAATYVGWQWQAGQGSTSSNTSGSITSTVSVNATAGFSVVTYTGIAGNVVRTFGHGLGVAPKMVIVKDRVLGTTGTDNWVVYHASATAAGFLLLNTTAAYSANANYWGNTTPTSTVVSVGGNASNVSNESGVTYVAYCWAEIAGFSKFGSYTGNGSTDGPFVYLGFRPKFLMWKRTDTTSNWNIEDSYREAYNSATSPNELYANLSNAEGTNGSPIFLSNGFKLTSTGAGYNASGGTYIYMAFAENPFKNALAR
jgi:hypothetical protein